MDIQENNIREIKIGKIYKHFKGQCYLVLTIAQHTELNQKMVIYQALYDDNKIYARPYEMFSSEVDKIKYPDSKQKYRFELLKSPIIN